MSKGGNRMNLGTEREECVMDYKNHNLIMWDDKCKLCHCYYTCRFLQMAYDDIIYGE